MAQARPAKRVSGQPADICIIFEGSYPYTRGGVSIWAHDLIQSLPNMTFHLWCLVARREDLKSKYELPKNVIGVTDVVLFEEPEKERTQKIPAAFWDSVREFHSMKGTLERSQVLWQKLAMSLKVGPDFPSLQYLLHPKAYEILVERYLERNEPLSFLDYFYTYLFAHLPLMRLMGQDIPPAKVYHTVSTGYAGFLGCRAKQVMNAPLILTEHGIYTNERQVEIILADWIYSRRDRRIQIGKSTTSLKQIWMELFLFLGRLTYDQSDRITTLFSGNRDMEIRFGAAPEKIDIIPNGVDLPIYEKIPRRTNPERPVVALVGRVVPIKDIRTFIKACRVVADAIPNALFKVLGTTEQSPAYYEKCLEYRRLMQLEERLEFTGNVDVIEYYPKIDVSVLTSVSEALPLTVIESMACGIPVVSTRVGSCEELLYGKDEEDAKLGKSGFIANVGDHKQVGEWIVKILKDPELSQSLGVAGKERVRQYYDLKHVHDQYESLYKGWLGKSRAG